MNPLVKAKNHPVNKKLLSSLSKRIKLKYKKNKDDGWASEIKNGVGIINYSRCTNPASALTHELLHIKLQLNGYQRIRIGISSYDQTQLFPRLMSCLDNELQHHKIYQEFIELGFKPENFYHDSDLGAEEYLRNIISKKHNKIIEILPDYCSIIAEGGSMSEIIKSEIENGFYKLNNGAYEAQLKAIKQAVVLWSGSSNLSSQDIFSEIMLILKPNDNFTWFGYDSENTSPDSGFFVDKEFLFKSP